MDLPDRGRRLVCRRCHVVMDDFEPADKNGEFWHPKLLKDQKTVSQNLLKLRGEHWV